MKDVVSKGYSQTFKDWIETMKMNIARLLFLCVSLLTGVRSLQAGVERGWDFYKEREYQLAAAEFEKAIASGHDHPETHEGLGWCYYWLGRYDSAEQEFQRSLEMNPNLTGPARGLGEVRKWRYLRFNTAWELFYGADYSSALAVFQEILNDQTNRLPAAEIWKVHSGIGWCFYNLGNYTEAEKSFQNILSIYKNNEFALKGLGFSQFRLGRYSHAEETLTAVLKLHPEWTDTHAILGWNYYMQNQYPDAEKAFLAALAVDADYADALYGIGWTSDRLGNHQRSLDHFTRAVAVTPYHPSVYDLFTKIDKNETWWGLYGDLGWSYYRLADYVSAEKTFNAGLKRLPGNHDLLRGLGFCQFKKNDYPAALEVLTRVDESTQNLKPVVESNMASDGLEYTIRSNTQSIIAWCRYYGGALDEAAALFRKNLETHGDWVDLHTGLAWCGLKQGDLKLAETHLENALKLNPTYSVALEGKQEIRSIRYADYNAAWNRYYSGDYSGAAKAFKVIIDNGLQSIQEKDHCLVWSGYGHSLLRQDSVDMAQDAFIRCHELNADNPYCSRGLAECSLKSNRPDEALKHIENAISQDGDNAEFYSFLGHIQYRRKKLAAAESAYLKALSLNAGVADAYAGLGWIALSKSNVDTAGKQFQTALNIDADNSYAAEGVEALNIHSDSQPGKTH